MTKQDLLNKGFKHFAKKEYMEARTYFEQALTIDDKFEAAYSALAESYNREGLVDKAIPIVKKWIEINPRDAIAHTALSRLYVQKGMIAEAEEEMAISNQLSQENSGL